VARIRARRNEGVYELLRSSIDITDVTGGEVGKRWIASSTRTAIRPARASYEERRRKEDEHARVAAERHAALKDPNNATGAKARSRTMTASPNGKEVSPTSATAT